MADQNFCLRRGNARCGYTHLVKFDLGGQGLDVDI